MDGLNDYIEVVNQAGINFTNNDSFTISVWLNSDEQGGGSLGRLVSKIGIPKHWKFKHDGYRYMVELRGSYNREISVRTLPFLVEIGKWQNIVMSYDGSNDASGINIYFNGTNSELFIGKNQLESTIDSSANLLIGDGVDGKIDEVMIWNKVLSEDEISGILCEVLS